MAAMNTSTVRCPGAAATSDRRRPVGRGLLLLSLLVWLGFPPAMSAGGVLYKGHEVHPTRILARRSQTGPALARPNLAGVLTPLGLEVRREYSLVPGLLLLDEPGAPAEAGAFAAGDLEARRLRLQERMASLQASGWFLYVEPDYQVKANLEPTDPAFLDGTLWGLRNIGISNGVPGADINATNAWNLTTGSTNVVVAVIDTGINYNHLELAAQMWRNPGEIAGNGVDDDGNGYVDDVYGINAITGSGNPLDDNDHGSHCSGTIGAAANDGQPHVGVAWQVRLMGCKFLSSSGSGNTSDAIECVAYAVSKRAKILSNSWGGGGFEQALFDAIAAANAQQVLFVAAAGNDGRNTDASPNYPSGYEVDNVISVAALDRADRLASFSNYGVTSVDLGAPGVAIYSCISGANNVYDFFSGTSMACPHVVGVAALLCAQFTTNVTVAELRQRLFESTTPVAALSGRTVSGGRVNAYQALTISEDGTLDVRLGFAGGLPLRAGSTTAVHFVVTDLVPVTNATVTAEIEGGGPLTVRNDGTAPDAVAGDHIYSASLVVPAGGGQIVLNYQATAPGKVAFSNSFTAPILVPPPNDMFASRIPVTGSSNRINASNLGASAEPGEPGHIGPTAYKSVWWSWTAPVTDTATIHTSGSSFDTTLAVYTGTSLGSLVKRASNDDTGSGLTSQVSFPATAGTTYPIAVDGYSGESGDIMLTVYQPAPAQPVIIQQPADRFAVAGGSATFTVQVSGAPPLSYQWSLAGNPLPGATTGSWTVSPVSAGAVGPYQVVITNLLGAVTSRVAQLRLIEIGNGFFDDFEPAADVAQWSEFSGEVVATNYGGSVSAVNSLWFNGDVTRSATTRPLNVQHGGEVGFWLRFGTAAVAPWELPDLPGEGVVVEYSVDGGATYVPLATFDTPEFFAWTRRSVALPAPAYSPATLLRWRQLAHSGNNADHWALDDVAVTLYTTPRPVQFLVQPASRTVEVGAAASFAPVVAGTAPITYQWRKGGLALAGATNLELVFPVVQTNDSGVYSLVASNALGAVPSSEAVLTVIPVLTLAEALDAPSLTWTAGGTLPWTGQTATTHDGADAGQSGAIAHSQETWVQTTVTGPGMVSFWWSVSSESNYDYLEFRTNGVVATRISGTAVWTLVSQRIASGPQALRWRYAKDSSVNTGQDRGWLDQVSFVPDGPTPPSIIAQPQNRIVGPGSSAVFSVGVAGSTPLAYQWRSTCGPLTGATTSTLTLPNLTTNQSGCTYWAEVTNVYGAATSAVATLTVLPVVPFCDALDACELTWATGGALPWMAQTTSTHDGMDAAQSGTITHNQETWLETTVVGPGLLSFWWQVSSEEGYDYLDFLINGLVADSIDGEVGWTLVQIPLAAGPQTLNWLYSKDDSLNSGQDRGWVDQVSFVPDGLTPPLIVAHPQDRLVTVNETATFSVTVAGTAPLSYFWQRNGSPIAGATQSSYTLVNCQLADSGSQFRCEITNAQGAVTSDAATLTVAQDAPLTFAAPAVITVPSSGAAPPYPSSLLVSGVNGSVLKVTATLRNLTHTWPDDLDILLVGPGGQKAMLLSDAGGSADLLNATLTLDSTAANPLPDNTEILAGTYRPTDYATGDILLAPAPIGPYGADLNVFNGVDPNGTWQLFVFDDSGGDSGSVGGGWELSLTVAVPLPVFLPAYAAGGNLHLRFETLTGHSYDVEFSDDLSAGSWHPLQTVVGDGTIHTVLDPLSASAHRFYRLRMN